MRLLSAQTRSRPAIQNCVANDKSEYLEFGAVIRRIVDMSSIQNEIKQTKPFRSAGHEAIVSVIRTGSDLTVYLESIVV